MTKHTPGPWEIGGSFESTEVFAPAASRVSVARCGAEEARGGGSYRVSTEEAQANARLIAAAPDLLEAAIYAAGIFAEKWDLPARDAIAALKIAISKATGDP